MPEQSSRLVRARDRAGRQRPGTPLATRTPVVGIRQFQTSKTTKVKASAGITIGPLEAGGRWRR